MPKKYRPVLSMEIAGAFIFLEQLGGATNECRQKHSTKY